MFCIFLERYQEHQKIMEEERQIIKNFKLKIQSQLASFLKNDNAETLQFDVMEKIFRSVITETTEESLANLHCHTFGSNERYVVVYKNPPSELEIEARRSDYTKWNKEIEIDFKRKRDLLSASTSISPQTKQTNSEAQLRNSKKKKMIHLKCEAIDINKNYGMVSTELKKDTRSIEQTLNDIQQKKKQLKCQHPSENK